MNKNLQILILVGLPGSGKDEFTQELLSNEKDWMRLSRDEFRTMNHSQTNLGRKEENRITDIIEASTSVLLKKEVNILLDVNPLKANYIQEYIEKYNDLADISFKVFEADETKLTEYYLRQYEITGNKVLPSVQKKYLKEFEELKSSFDFSNRPKLEKDLSKLKQDRNLPKALICDLDGTLALLGSRPHYDASQSDKDELNVPVANTLKFFAKEGYKIFLVTGRYDSYLTPTLRFLEMHNIPYDQLLMRKAKDFRKDSVVKQEIYDQHIAGKYYIEFVLDDRDQSVNFWRNDLNIPCFQVNYGDF